MESKIKKQNLLGEQGIFLNRNSINRKNLLAFFLQGIAQKFFYSNKQDYFHFVVSQFVEMNFAVHHHLNLIQSEK